MRRDQLPSNPRVGSSNLSGRASKINGLSGFHRVSLLYVGNRGGNLPKLATLLVYSGLAQITFCGAKALWHSTSAKASA